MSYSKDAWMDAVANTCEDFAADNLTLDEAAKELIRLGFSRDEAETMLKESIS